MKHRKKGDLPTKICRTCGRQFAWRKKWERCWEEVLYCSDRCRGERPRPEPHLRAKDPPAGRG